MQFYYISYFKDSIFNRQLRIFTNEFDCNEFNCIQDHFLVPFLFMTYVPYAVYFCGTNVTSLFRGTNVDLI